MSARSNVMALTPDVRDYGQASQKPCVRSGSLFCSSGGWSELLAPLTKADAGEAVIAKPAKPITAAQAMPLKVFDAQPL
jgi:hypothetical protein